MRRLAGRAPALLGRWWLPLATIVLALLLVSPSLGIGPMGDDYMHMARVDPRLHAPGFAYAPLDLFTFVSGDPSQRSVLLEEGVFGWWMAADSRVAFWRPLSSLTHVLDHLLWPRSWVLAHAHSMTWFAALLVVLTALYRRFHAPWIAHLALVLYAVDDARGWVLGWVAHRNALVAATLAFAALLVHDRARRDGWRPGRWLAPALFAAALLGGEAALGVTGYLLAHALFIDSGPLPRRLARLWPYAALSVAWLAAYKALGYGTSGGGMYLNPLDEPTTLSARPGRAPARPARGPSLVERGRRLAPPAAAGQGRSLRAGARRPGRVRGPPRPAVAPPARVPFLGARSRALPPARVRHVSDGSAADLRGGRCLRRGRSRPRRVAGGRGVRAPSPRPPRRRHDRRLAARLSAPRARAAGAAGPGPDRRSRGADGRTPRGLDPQGRDASVEGRSSSSAPPRS